jgi:N utilization substance protein B
VGNRRKARECALQILYSLEYNRIDDSALNDWVDAYWSVFSDTSQDTPDVKEYMTRLVQGVRSHFDELDTLIQSASTNWKLERMAMVDRNILRLAAFELVQLSDIPPKVSLNEAIEIGKRFGTEDSGSFINGILDKISSTK